MGAVVPRDQAAQAGGCGKAQGSACCPKGGRCPELPFTRTADFGSYPPRFPVAAGFPSARASGRPRRHVSGNLAVRATRHRDDCGNMGTCLPSARTAGRWHVGEITPMRRIFFRLSALTTVLILGIIAIAHAQRGASLGFADVQSPDTAADRAGPQLLPATPRALPAASSANPLRPAASASSGVTAAAATSEIATPGSTGSASAVASPVARAVWRRTLRGWCASGGRSLCAPRRPAGKRQRPFGRRPGCRRGTASHAGCGGERSGHAGQAGSLDGSSEARVRGFSCDRSLWSEILGYGSNRGFEPGLAAVRGNERGAKFACVADAIGNLGQGSISLRPGIAARECGRGWSYGQPSVSTPCSARGIGRTARRRSVAIGGCVGSSVGSSVGISVGISVARAACGRRRGSCAASR